MNFSMSTSNIEGQVLDNSSVTSEVIDIRFQYGYAVYVEWTVGGAAAAGTFQLQGSTDNENWFNVGSGSADMSSSSGNATFNVVDPFYLYLRFTADETVGTNDITLDKVRVSTKGQ